MTTNPEHGKSNTLKDKSDQDSLESPVELDMTEEEAKACAEKIREKELNLRLAIDELRRRKGYLALGYETFEECMEAEFGFSRGYGSRLSNAHRISRNLSEDGKYDKVPESTLRPLNSLEPESQIKAYNDALAKSFGFQPTAKQVEQAITDLGDSLELTPAAKIKKKKTGEKNAKKKAKEEADKKVAEAEKVKTREEASKTRGVAIEEGKDDAETEAPESAPTEQGETDAVTEPIGQEPSTEGLDTISGGTEKVDDIQDFQLIMEKAKFHGVDFAKRLIESLSGFVKEASPQGYPRAGQ